MTKNEKARFSARENVLNDKRLSPGARFLYILLDHLSGFKGESWYKQETIAQASGVSARTIRLWLVELKPYVSVIRCRYTAVYALRWSPRDRKPVADLVSSDRKYIAGQIGSPLPISNFSSYCLMNQDIESGFEIEPTCKICGDLGRIGKRMTDPICDCLAGAAIRARLNRRRA